MIGWKKVEIRNESGFVRNAILKLKVTGRVIEPTRKAEVLSSRGIFREVTKFRTDKLTVLAAYRPRTLKPVVLKEGEYIGAAHWSADEFRYVVGKVHKPQFKLNTDVGVDCASGLHFFDRRSNAEDWDR